jgi:CHRD domain
MWKPLLLVLGACMFAGSVAGEQDAIHLRAKLSPLKENPTNVTDGTGTFRAVIVGDQMRFRLTYSNLSTPVAQAHIHVGATKINGAIAIFFCGPAGSPAHQTCPNDSTNSGTVTGTVGPADVVIDAQGISPGEFQKVLRAIVHEATYVNVHTTRLPGGEIRGQARTDRGDDDEDE